MQKRYLSHWDVCRTIKCFVVLNKYDHTGTQYNDTITHGQISTNRMAECCLHMFVSTNNLNPWLVLLITARSWQRRWLKLTSVDASLCQDMKKTGPQNRLTSDDVSWYPMWNPHLKMLVIHYNIRKILGFNLHLMMLAQTEKQKGLLFVNNKRSLWMCSIIWYHKYGNMTMK